MEDILQRLPHRPPFVMIDRISTEETGVARAEFFIKEDNVLLEGGFFSESGLVEHMAQAAGAGLPQPVDGKAPAVGYIGALKELRVENLPAAGETIYTEVIYLHQIMNAHIVQATVTDGSGKRLAACELKIFLQT